MNGSAYDLRKKLEIEHAINQYPPGALNKREVARKCNVSATTVSKVEKEIVAHGGARDPKEIRKQKAGPVGLCSKELDECDAFVLFRLYLEEPSRSLESYVMWLELYTGTHVSTSTVSRFFNHCFPHKGGLCRPNLVPLDKFRPANIQKAFEYLEIISKFAPHRIKFCDEKHLKGKEVFNRKNRRNVLTGEVPFMPTSSDMTNTYTMFGVCGINPATPAAWCSIHDGINDAEQIGIELENAIQAGAVVAGDILVFDNARVHTGGENTVLEEHLWKNHGVYAVFLPARAPEWNPIEQVWKHLVQRLRAIPLEPLRRIPHATARAAVGIIGEVTHNMVRKFFQHSGVLPRDII